MSVEFLNVHVITDISRIMLEERGSVVRPPQQWASVGPVPMHACLTSAAQVRGLTPRVHRVLECLLGDGSHCRLLCRHRVSRRCLLGVLVLRLHRSSGYLRHVAVPSLASRSVGPGAPVARLHGARFGRDSLLAGNRWPVGHVEACSVHRGMGREREESGLRGSQSAD